MTNQKTRTYTEEITFLVIIEKDNKQLDFKIGSTTYTNAPWSIFPFPGQAYKAKFCYVCLETPKGNQSYYINKRQAGVIREYCEYADDAKYDTFIKTLNV